MPYANPYAPYSIDPARETITEELRSI
jgi:hypothetical protein